jgi:hypothetical protein
VRGKPEKSLGVELMKSFLFRWVATLSVVLVAACGGGSGSSNDGGPFGGPGGDGTGGGTGGTPLAPKVSVVLSSATVTAGSPSIVTAKVQTAAGDSLGGQVVNFSTANGRGSFSAASALTDGNGVATVTLSPSSAASAGADTVIASTTVAGQTATAEIGFQLTATDVTISSFTSDLTTISAYGQTLLTVNLSGATAGTPVSIAMSSSCVSKGRATLTPATATTSTGSATFTYRDNGCGSFDPIDGLQASVTGTTATAALQLTLTAPTVSSISFVSASPDQIFLKGSGFVENSNVTFQVRDENGLGVPNRLVLLEPTTLAGGLLVDGGSVPVTKQTDAEGKVLVRVNSGTVPTPVRIKATLQGTAISTVSSSLAIAVGLPSQNNFSLSQAIRNIEGANIDGTANTYTIIASDRLGNPVPTDTAINYVTEGGQVQAIRFTSDFNGLSRAVANFQSSEPRPVDGRVTVTAYALGEESFLDANGNNVYDSGEDYQDLGDVFLDRLRNRTFNGTNDQFISLGIAGTDSCRVATSVLLRLDNSSPSRSLTNTGSALNTCVAGWGRAYVRRSVETIFSTSEARPIYGNAIPAGASGTPTALSLLTGYGEDDAPVLDTFYVVGTTRLSNRCKTGVITFFASDNNPVAFNPMAAGTVLTLASTDGMAVAVAGGSPVPNTSTPNTMAVSFAFDEAIFSGTVTLSFKSPSGLTTAIPQIIERAPLTATSCL